MQKSFPEEGKSRRTIGALGFASFFNDLGAGMIHPVWPLFLTGVLGANMSVLGFIDGLGEALVSISQAASGYLSDRLGKRKVFVWLGYAVPILSRTGYALSTTWQQIIPFKILDRAGKIRGAPRDAIIADLSSRMNRGTHFGYRKMMDNLGALGGILICILLFHLTGYRILFLIAALPSVIATILIVLCISESKPERRIHAGLRLSDIEGDFRRFLILSSLFALGSFSYSFLLIFAKELGFGITSIPALYLIFTAAASLTSLPLGRLSDRIGRRPLLMFSFLLWGLVCLLFITTRSHYALILGFILYGCHKGALDTVQTTFASELCPVAFRASSLGSLRMIVGLCALPASFIAGLLWDRINLYAPFYLSLMLTVFSMVLLLFVKDRKSGNDAAIMQ